MSVAGVLLHDEPLTPHPVFQLIRPGAERELVGRLRAQTIVGSFIGDEALPKAKQQRGIRTLGAQSDGKRVDRLDRDHVGDGARLFAIGVLLNTGERVHDIGRREIAAIVELDALLKLEYPSAMVRIAPRLGENRNDLFLAPAPFDQWLDHMFPGRIDLRGRMSVGVQGLHLNAGQGDRSGNLLLLLRGTLRLSAGWKYQISRREAAKARHEKSQPRNFSMAPFSSFNYPMNRLELNVSLRDEPMSMSNHVTEYPVSVG